MGETLKDQIIHKAKNNPALNLPLINQVFHYTPKVTAHTPKESDKNQAKIRSEKNKLLSILGAETMSVAVLNSYLSPPNKLDKKTALTLLTTPFNSSNQTLIELAASDGSAEKRYTKLALALLNKCEKALLLKIASDRTGYPEDMVALDQDIEADLGIDSIKRVEILGLFRRSLPVVFAQGLRGEMEEVARLPTFQAILDFVQRWIDRQPKPAVSAPAGENARPFDGAGADLIASADLPRHVLQAQTEPLPATAPHASGRNTGGRRKTASEPATPKTALEPRPGKNLAGVLTRWA